MVQSAFNPPYRSQQFHGKGQAVLRSHQDEGNPAADIFCTFTHLSYTFPLKLLTPRISSRHALNSARAERQKAQTAGGTTVRGDLSGSKPSVDSSSAPYIFTLEEEAERAEWERRRLEQTSISEPSQTDLGAEKSSPGKRQDDDKAIAALFIVGYGGGLVSGDKVSLDIDVGSKSVLLLLTQGSTKVFKSRKSFAGKQDLAIMRNQHEFELASRSAVSQTSSDDPSMHPSTSVSDPDSDSRSRAAPDPITSQLFRCLIRSCSTLILLPDPVTCFTNSKYHQTQFFDLRDRYTSSLVLLDWITPGRVLSVASESASRRGNVGFGLQNENEKVEGQGEEKEKPNQHHGNHSGPELWQFQSYRSRNVSYFLHGRLLLPRILQLPLQKSTREKVAGIAVPPGQNLTSFPFLFRLVFDF